MKKTRFLDASSILVAGISCCCALSGACSDTPDAPAPADPNVADSQSEWVIRFYSGGQVRAVGPDPMLRTGDDDNRTDLAALAHLGPDAFSKRGTAAPPGKKSTNAPGSSVSTDSLPPAGTPGTGGLTAAVLLQGAIQECVSEGAATLVGATKNAPWKCEEGQCAMFMFSADARGCDAHLAKEEVTLCAAGKLKQVADAVAPVTWMHATVPGLPSPWIFPPQSNVSKFVARDVALYTLANLVFLDLYRFDIPVVGDFAGDLNWHSSTCGEIWSHFARNDAVAQALTPEAAFSPGYDAPGYYFPNPKDGNGDSDNQATARTRLIFLTHLMRAGSRLLRDLVDDSVQADLASAAAQRAHAADPSRGAAAAWGQRDDGLAPWNSLAHAVRVVAGRWEGLGSPGALLTERRCGGVNAMDLLRKTYGADLDARQRKRSPLTLGEERALAIIENAGIIVPPEGWVAGSAFDATRSAVRAAVIGRAAQRQGIDPNGADFAKYASSQEGAAIGAVFDAIGEQDLRFALQDTHSTYRMLTSEGPLANVLAPHAGLAPGNAYQGGLDALGGLVLPKAMPRVDVAGDVYARVGGILESSTCNESAAWLAGIREVAYESTFRDSFGVAQAMEGRLHYIREQWGTFNAPSWEEDGGGLAAMAVAEVHSWAGPGQLQVMADQDLDLGDGTHGPQYIYVTATGFEPADWGVPTATTPERVGLMAEQLVLVYGEPWVADCAARLRDNCPADFEANYVAVPQWSEVLYQDAIAKRNTNADGMIVNLRFDASSVAEFVPRYHPTPTGTAWLQPSKHLYAVLRHDPSQPTGRGKVIASIAIRSLESSGTVAMTKTPVSTHQRELLDAILGVSESWADTGKKAGGTPTNVSKAYCITNGKDVNVPYDIFVPLENELTSDGDGFESSWRHYIASAKAAAARADELGKQMIDIGLQRDLRREAAQEEAGKICGDFHALDALTTKGSKVTVGSADGSTGQNGTGNVASPSDQALSDCLSEKRVDLVFLTSDPVPKELPQGMNATQWLKKFTLRCPGTGVPNPSPPGNDLCEKDTITYDSLGLATAPPQPAPPVCDSVNVTRSLVGGFAGTTLAQKVANDSFHKGAFEDYLASLSMEVKANGAWKVTSVLTDLMDSDPDKGRWPGCRVSGAVACENPDLAWAFDRAFRKIPASATVGPPLANSHEHEEIRWRVQGAIWTMAVLAGGAPAGTFSGPVPARDWSAGGTTGPLLTIFGRGTFQEEPASSGVFKLVGGYSGDLETAGDATGIPTGWTVGGNGEVPNALSSIYAEPAKYKHIMGRSEALKPFGGVDPALETHVASILTRLNGLKCDDAGDPNFGGNPAAAGPGAGDAVTELSNMRNALGVELCHRAPGNIVGLDRFPGGNTKVTMADTFYGIEEEGVGVKLTAVIPYETSSDADKSWGRFVDPANMQKDGEKLYKDALGWDYVAKAGDCRTYTGPFGVDAFPSVTKECVATDASFYQGARYTGRLLGPGWCDQGMRLPAFVNSYTPSACGSAASLAQAFTLACVLRSGGGLAPPDIAAVPPVKFEEDIPKLVAWMETVSKQAAKQASALYLERVPDRVIKDFKAKKVGSGSNKGQHGQLLLELSGALQGQVYAWNQISGAVSRFAFAVGDARNQIAAANLHKKGVVIDLEIRRIQAYAAMAHAAAGAVAACSVEKVSFGGCTAGLVDAAAQLEAGLQTVGKVDELNSVAGEVNVNQISTALEHLGSSAEAEFRNVQHGLTQLRQNTALAAEKLSGIEALAQYQAAKGAGKDFYIDPVTKKTVTYPVNTVLNHQYDVTKRRYEAALRDARYLAYVARRSVEQRIGVNLGLIADRVGPYEAPAQWADDVCHMQGINYEKLRCFDVPADAGAAGSGGGGSGGASGASGAAGAGCDLGKDAIKNFADQYIGDYVAKLENFVEYYNIQYPSHEGDDVAILSLRDDLVGPGKTCLADGPNLLLYSGRLDASDAAVEQGAVAFRGWATNACGGTLKDGNGTPVEPTKCLQVRRGVQLAGGVPDAPDGTLSDITTWLRDTLPSELPPPVYGSGGSGGAAGSGGSGGAGAAGSGGSGGAGSAGAGGNGSGVLVGTTAGNPLPDLPGASVGQVVHLTPGKYVLSWWDRAVAFDGTFPTTATADYSVAVLQAGGAPIADSTPTPAVNGWSPRRVLSFQVGHAGDFVVSLRASASAVAGSVAIAGVQLERVTTNGDLPGPYVNTSSSRKVVSLECKDRPGNELQKMFVHKCTDAEGCFYELATAVPIDTIPLSKGGQGKLAAGNFNYRHISLALNLVGTGVLDCSGTGQQSCYSSGFVEYSLFHDAYKVKIVNAVGDPGEFSFGTATINHAKGLTAEKYITNPISGSDKGLLDQAAIQKGEFRGRPLDGQYRLRIWDNPALRWDKLQDIQLVLTYRYWAPINKESGGN